MCQSKHSDLCHYSQVVIFADIVKCSGQGGWTASGELDANGVRGQVDLAFQNVDRVLQECGLRGWEDVYSVRSYHVDMGSSYDSVAERLKARVPATGLLAYLDCYCRSSAGLSANVD
ncbi:hypothetical protein Asppvi_000170 [Aspergillus pseudoviridinutans]|uniref:Uncharacterized protein n=1 Tax=Aspergillus pseudoviridinutans TaxID=1517512 RepID=A0A9P3ENV0_9EURO|nr:uncharacterized protein Asppvi_000170 [Aspergillus pseudoviridinutans]GIJ81671.1 hypothetical protein Asppvi_000170 [Aspergillus pseudoviridinutans]